jgi:NADH-quinone oxidoreductase subunit G
VVGVGVFADSEAKELSAVLPGAAFTEKDGTIVNFQGQEQKLKRSVLPAGKSKALSEILALWTHQGAGLSAQTGSKSSAATLSEGAV